MKVTLSCSKARPNWVGWRFRPAVLPLSSVIVADEDAAVNRRKKPAARRNGAAVGAASRDSQAWFPREELCGQDFPGGVILHAESGELRAASFEPIVRAAVELHEFAEPRGAHAALTMRREHERLRGDPRPVLAQQTAQCSRPSAKPSRSTSSRTDGGH